MSATSLLDKPLLKVSRPVAACSRCRTAKIKCDGKLPACSACERVGKASTCSGASDEFARGKERSYVASLEGYCERLEKRIADLRQRKESFSVEGTETVWESSITSISSPENVVQAHRKEVSDIDDLVGDFGFLSVNATSRDFHGIKSSTSFANLLLSLSVAEPFPKVLSQSLPSRHEITPLLQHYFDSIFTQMPFFVETSFWTSVDTVYQSKGRFAKPYDNWIVRMVLATSFASISYQIGDRDHLKALSLVFEALEYAEDVLRPGSIMGIQAILLLAQYSLVDPKHFRSWFLVGMAVRAMIDLGLHQDPSSEVQPTSDHIDIRRSVYHCIYCLDRGVSTALERTFSFSDDSVNVALPSTSASLSPALAEQRHVFLHNSEPAWHLVKIRQILSTAYRSKFYDGYESPLHTPISTWSLCFRAREWFENTPKNAPRYFTVLYKLELLYTTIIILSPLHRHRHLTMGDYNKVLLFDRCMEYINQVHQVLENPSLLPFMTFLVIQRAYQVSRRLIELLTQDYDLVLSATVPECPSVPPDTPEPPVLDGGDRVNRHACAVVCLDYTQDLLQYCLRRWGINTLSNEFQEASISVRKRLMQSSVVYSPGSGAYMAGQPTTLPSAGTRYSGFDMRQFGS